MFAILQFNIEKMKPLFTLIPSWALSSLPILLFALLISSCAKEDVIVDDILDTGGERFELVETSAKFTITSGYIHSNIVQEAFSRNGMSLTQALLDEAEMNPVEMLPGDRYFCKKWRLNPVSEFSAYISSEEMFEFQETVGAVPAGIQGECYLLVYEKEIFSDPESVATYECLPAGREFLPKISGFRHMNQIKRSGSMTSEGTEEFSTVAERLDLPGTEPSFILTFHKA